MAKSIGSILREESCLNCRNNCRGYCPKIHKPLDPNEIAMGKMACAEEGDSRFAPILDEWMINHVEQVWSNATIDSDAVAEEIKA